MDVKKRVGEKAVEWIKDGMTVGLGTGTTAYWAIQKIGERVKEGLRVRAVASSVVSEQLARERAIPLVSFAEIDHIDITIDGADEVDAEGNLIKGGGGALLREKLLAYHSRLFLVVVDESKLVEVLGRYPLPVEVVPFGAELTVRRLARLGCVPRIREEKEGVVITDNGNWVVDCAFGTIGDPAGLERRLKDIPGIVETGVFLHPMVSTVLVGHKDGTVSERKELGSKDINAMTWNL